jgi:hypothetical protein
MYELPVLGWSAERISISFRVDIDIDIDLGTSRRRLVALGGLREKGRRASSWFARNGAFRIGRRVFHVDAPRAPLAWLIRMTRGSSYYEEEKGSQSTRSYGTVAHLPSNASATRHCFKHGLTVTSPRYILCLTEVSLMPPFLLLWFQRYRTGSISWLVATVARSLAYKMHQAILRSNSTQ